MAGIGGLRARFEFLGEHFLAIVIDTVFLVLWLLLQWAVEQVIEYFRLSDTVDNDLLLAFRALFAVSTMAPVAIQTYVDISIMFIRSANRLRQEKNASRV